MKSELIFNILTIFGYTVATTFMLNIFKNMETLEPLKVPDAEVYLLTASSKLEFLKRTSTIIQLVNGVKICWVLLLTESMSEETKTFVLREKMLAGIDIVLLESTLHAQTGDSQLDLFNIIGLTLCAPKVTF